MKEIQNINSSGNSLEVSQQENTLGNNEVQLNLSKNSTNSQDYTYESVAQRAQQTLQDIDDTSQLAQEYCNKYPELVPFKDAIINEAMAALIESHMNDPKLIDDREALERGIKTFQQKLGLYHHNQTQKSNQMTLNHKMLKLDMGYSIPDTQPHSIKQTLNIIGDNDKAFNQYRKHFLHQKGIKS